MIKLDLSYKEIYPRIFVYQNLLPYKTHIHSTLRNSLASSDGRYYFGEWLDWYGFGRLCAPKHHDNENTDFTNEMYELERDIESQLQNAISVAFSHYIGFNKIELPDDCIISRVSCAAYYEGVETGQGNVMQYHTDYLVNQHFSRFENFLFTCTIYINDDYEGGEVKFATMDGESFSYKPTAGDIVIFPSGSPLYPNNEPYFHAVGMVRSGTKFLIRAFVKYQNNGSPEWLANEQLYGPDEWQKMENERIRSVKSSNQMQIIDGVKHYSQDFINAFGLTEDDQKRLGYGLSQCD